MAPRASASTPSRRPSPPAGPPRTRPSRAPCASRLTTEPAHPTSDDLRRSSVMTTTDASTTRIDKSRNPEPPFDKLTVGVGPDQWGVWSPEAGKLIHWGSALAGMAEAGVVVMKEGRGA